VEERSRPTGRPAGNKVSFKCIHLYGHSVAQNWAVLIFFLMVRIPCCAIKHTVGGINK
jgi:hypothetical protein